MKICRLCNQEQREDAFSLVADICIECATVHGLPPPGPPLRPRTPCARCSGTTLIRCKALRGRGAVRDERVGAAPLAAAFEQDIERTLWANRGVQVADLTKPIGIFEAYVCRSCGFAELYVRDPASIPIGEEHATELFDASGDTPYR